MRRHIRFSDNGIYNSKQFKEVVDYLSKLLHYYPHYSDYIGFLLECITFKDDMIVLTTNIKKYRLSRRI